MNTSELNNDSTTIRTTVMAKALNSGEACYVTLGNGLYRLTMPGVVAESRDSGLISIIADRCAEAMGGWE